MEISIKWNICRVCLAEENGAENNMKEIFTGTVLAKRIYECSGIKMTSKDGLPEKICQKCLMTLRHAMNFRTKCRESDEYLRKVMEKAKSTTLFEPAKKTKEDIEDSDPFDMIEEVLDEPAQGLEIEAENDYFYSNEVIENSTTQKTASNDILTKTNEVKNEQKLKNTIKSVPAKIEQKAIPKSSFKSKEPPKSDLVISHVHSLHISNVDAEENTTNNRKINLNFLERKDKGRQKTPTDELNINHVIDNDNKSTYRVEFINAAKKENTDVDDEGCVVRKSLKSLDKKQQTNVKIQTQMKNQLKESISKEDKTENYYVVVTEQEEDKNDNEGSESDDEMRVLPHLDVVEEKREESEFVGVSNEFILADGDELGPENILEYNGDGESQSDYHAGDIPSNSEDMMSSDNERKDKALDANIAKKLRGRRERTHLDKKIFPKSRKVRDKDNATALVCETCGNSFTCRTSLKSHLRMHRQDKLHECELCSKRFSAACNLTAHMRTHTGEKPYACQFCDRRFADRSTHIKHERTHTNEKPFQCTICLKAFSLSTSLRAHELVHTGEKRHSCLPCKKAFKLPHQLKAHYKTQLHKIIVNEISSNDGEQLSD